MPSFGRRRAATNPASHNPPSASASLAATKAFIRDRDSNASLSSAAAAAALRTHTVSPTPVGDTITKRMVRKGSTSSHGSGSQQAGGLRRHSSSGSMTERTFRAPSPARNSPVDHNAPPVPSVPKAVPDTSVVHRRASSLEPPFRGGSPAGRGGGRGGSLDRGGQTTTTSGRGQRVVSLSQVPEYERDGSPRSINFSRPISPQQTMTPPRSTPSQRGGHSGWFGGPVVNAEATFRGSPKARPKTSDGVSSLALHTAQQTVQNAADRPVSTKKTQLSHGVEGARLATGSMRAKPTGSAVQTGQTQSAQAAPQRPRTVDPKSPYAVYDPSTRTFIHKQDAMNLHRQLSEGEEGLRQQYVAQHVEPARAHAPAPQPVVQQRTAPMPEPQHYPSPQQPVRRLESPIKLHEDDHPASHAEEGTEMEEAEEQRPTLPTQAKAGATLARQTSEDFAKDDVRPSIDANTSRKLETTIPTPAPVDQTPDSPASPRFATNQDSPYPRLGTPVISTTTNTLAKEGRGSVRTESRTHSLSPPRNAHFNAVAIELPNGVRHQPPPRSLSPAKSALKSSPSVSRRNSSPIANNGRVVSGGASSEASDTISEDGTRKKKKSVRVSFEEEPVIAGTSAYAETDTPTSPTGLGASKWSTANQEQDLDDFMKPRPVLPSFGSIRDKSRRTNGEEVPEKVTETVSSSMTTSVGSIGEPPLEVSSDHAVGGILAQDFAKKNVIASPHEPLPPEVTSVEGSGYVSDSSSSSEEEIEATTQGPMGVEPQLEPARTTPEPEPKTLTEPLENKPPTPATAPEVPMEVPVIAIQPASPSPAVEKPEPKFTPPFVPGGWGEDDESEHEAEEKEQDMPLVTTTSAPVPLTSENLPQAQDDSSSDDNSSIYSDAYEDLSEAEDGGFASIDAVVESPILAPTSGLMFSKYADQSPVEEPPKSSLRNEVALEPEESTAGPSGNLDMTQQHWNNVNDSRKQQAEEPAIERTKRVEPPVLLEPAEEITTPVEHAPAKKGKTAKERNARIEPVVEATKTTQPSQPRPAAKPRKSAMKKTTVAQPTNAPEPQLRKTMRSGTALAGASSAEPQMRKSMRTGTPSSPTDQYMRKSMRTAAPTQTGSSTLGLAASRHSMPPVETKQPRGALQKKHIPAAAPTSRARPKSASGPISSKPIAPAPTYDSDSDASVSSFQRSRPRASRKGESGRYTMRASMRSGPAPTMRPTPTPTMRPQSPPQTTSPPPTTMRKSMRPTSPTTESAGLRSSKFSIRSLSPAGRFRTGKTTADDAPPLPSSPKRTSMASKFTGLGKEKKAKTPPASASKPRFKSRFVDSSDEDEEERPRRFQSRFADSDDEDNFELPPGLAPVRGIPRRPGEEDAESTDLEDEASDNELSPAMPKDKDVEMGEGPTTNGNTPANGQGTKFAASSLRQSKHATELPTIEAGKKAKSKRGFFGLGKKKASYIDPVDPEPAAQSTEILMPPERRNHSDRPLTPIGEDKDIEAPPTTKRSPKGKLQRRSGTPEWGRSTSDHWPLTQRAASDAEQRPQSSDGVPARKVSLRPALSKRHSSQVSNVSEAMTATDPKGREVVVGKSGKKKKFQGLRRVFGLND